MSARGAGLAAAVVALAVATPRGAAAQPQPGWEVRVPERVELASGAPGTLPVAIAVDRGLAVSRDAAVIVDLAPPAAVAVRRRRLGRGDAADPGADAPRFAIPVRAEAPGEHVVTLRVRFWVCGSKVCRPVDVRRSAVIAVAPPAPPPAPPPPAPPP